MNVSVSINSIDASPFIVNYEREDKICTGKGLFHLVLSLTCYSTFADSDIQPWKEILLYENDVVVKRYNINTVDKNLPTNSVEITAQDGSKYLEEYFIPTASSTTDATTTKYWMEHYLTETGVSYSFVSTGYGNLLPNDTALGMVTAYEQMIQLLQLSGWYMYFNADNTCIIGKLNKDLSVPDISFDKEDIITIHTHADDKSLRNRAVVWGKGDPITSEWIFADVFVITKWNYDDNDKRTIVLSSPNVPNFSTAHSLAYKFIDEFARLNYTKEATIYGARDIEVGDIVFLDTDIFSGTGLVTTVGTEMSSMGLITKVVLDERCPRLLGYYDWGGYVYVGTWGGGVRRKHLKDLTTWGGYSIGLTDLYIKDLYVGNGILSCVTKTGKVFVSKEVVGTWSEIILPTLSGVSQPQLKARAVTQDRNNNNIRLVVDSADNENDSGYGLISYSGEIVYTWLLDIDPTTRNTLGIYPIVYSGIDSFCGYDIENDGFNDYVAVIQILEVE